MVGILDMENIPENIRSMIVDSAPYRGFNKKKAAKISARGGAPPGRSNAA
jgi:hypothetical protein